MSEPTASKVLTYGSSGVDYGPLDAFKRACQRHASLTTPSLASHQLREPAHVRGESAYLLEGDEFFLAHVEEGLGTKNLVADAVRQATGNSFYQNIGIDTVATIVNDLVTTGALPISVAMHAAVGDSQWFADLERAEDLAKGFARGCELSGAVWGGGETPALKGLVNPEGIILAGSAVGIIKPKSHRIAGRVNEGDAIILLASSGVQTNGLTLCRALADRLPDRYATKMDDGRTYGEALLDPSVIYVKFISAVQRAGLAMNYAIHMTGHGWRKLMRLNEPWVYRMSNLGAVPEVFRFILKHGPVDIREAYATFNMGAGFAVIVPMIDAPRIMALAEREGYTAWLGGSVAREGSRKAVELIPLNIHFDSESLNVR